MTIGGNGGPPLRDAGWYATHRDMLNHPVVGIGKPVKPADPSRGSLSRFEAWHWLIANAAYGEHEYRNKGAVQTLQPGQLVGGREYLAKTWNWSDKTVRWFLKVLIDEQMITLATDRIKGQQRANTANIITLCNYLKYQLGEDEVKHVEGPANGQPTATEGPANGQIYNKETNKQITPNSARDVARSGQDRGRAFWAEANAVPGAYNPNEGVLRDPATGSLQLVNGVRAAWLERFENDGVALDLALIQAAAFVKPNGAIPIKAQVEAQLAKQLGWKADRAKSEKLKQASGTSVSAKLRAMTERQNGGTNV